METAFHSHEGSENVRTALSGCVGGMPAAPAAAATPREEAPEGDITIVADDSAACYGASIAPPAFTEDFGHPPRARDAGEEVIVVGAAAVAAAAEAAPAGNSGQSPPTTVTPTPPARSVADTPAGPGPTATCPDRSSGAISQLEATWSKYEFPFVEDAEQTWDNAVKTLEAAVGGSYKLTRRNKGKLLRNGPTNFAADRWSIVWLVCAQGGTRNARERVADQSLRRKSFSKKVNCSFKVVMNWPGRGTAPYISQVCLGHRTTETGEKEHEPPRVFENEMTAAEVHEQEDMIRYLHERRVDTASIHKAVETNRKRLGVHGKQKVRNIRSKVDKENAMKSSADASVYNDAHMFLKQLQQENCFVRFSTDKDDRISCIAWAHEEQVQNAVRYHSIVVQDNTFNTCMYKFQLALIIVVDRENHTQLAMQALASRERTEDFVFIFETFRDLCGGSHPEVIFTDADKAAMAATGLVFPQALHKLCIYHTMENIRKHCGGLGPRVLAAVLGKFRAAAYTHIESAFLGHKAGLFSILPQGSKAYEYMSDHIFGPGRVQKWASYVHPGAHTLGIASTQRVESANSALKHVLKRSATMVEVDRAIIGKVQDDANKTARLTTAGTHGRVSLRNGTAEGGLRDRTINGFAYVRQGMEREQCSVYATEHTMSEVVAALGYEADVVVSGADGVRSLLCDLKADPSKGRLQHQVDDGAPAGSSTTTPDPVDATMLARTSIPHYVDLVIDQDIFELVRVKPAGVEPGVAKNDYGHLVALGPDGFFLCTCLMSLVEGLPCRHGIKAIMGKDVSFNAACVAPRWRTSTTPWTMEALAAKPAKLRPSSSGSSAGQHTAGTCLSVSARAKQNLRSAVYANCLAFGEELAALSWEICSLQGHTRMLDTLADSAKALIKAELRSQKNTSSPRSFQGRLYRADNEGNESIGQGAGEAPGTDSQGGAEGGEVTEVRGSGKAVARGSWSTGRGRRRGLEGERPGVR